jgi:hypothetical protein
MGSELKQSNDSEQSIRAYYAAQSGVENGLQKVVAQLRLSKTPQLCPSGAAQNLDLVSGSPGTVGWTCQQITYSGPVSGTITSKDKATQIDLGDAKFGSVVLEWDTSKRPTSGFPANYFNAPLAGFPAAGGWGYAAPVELTVVEYPSAAFNAATSPVNLYNALIIPRTSGMGSVSYTTLRNAGRNPLQGTCSAAAATYHCRMVLDGFGAGAKNFVLRLRTRYVDGTSYKLTFTQGNNGAGAVVPVPDGTATIDVTAKAGDVYRRVIYKVPYQNGVVGGLDYVIYSDQDICKNFTVLSGTPDTGCPY